MSVRKNAKFLTPAEKQNFVKACVLMKADVVNPGAAAAARYSRWDEFVAIHQMIQNAFAPGDTFVNFGHGGNGAYGFLSWHRYFLYRFELQLRSYVPGIRLPYWDWTDPAPLMVDTFLGPNGSTSNEVRSGHFARNAPGTPGNPTPAPAWWPAGLTGWTLPAFFGVWQGALRRILKAPALLPGAEDLRNCLAMTTYAAFQNALESGAGLPTAATQHMHNGVHGWINGHMTNSTASPFDPIFYLHHCNIDRLWAMWQADGHADEYPDTGGRENHLRNDVMYPWTGGIPGYGNNAAIAAFIPMPDFSALGAKRNGDTLDFRNAFGYTYDTLPVIGIGLDRANSMNGLTPDPMTSGAPDVSKWQAARRGVSAFLQDCETVQASATMYVTTGVKTFRRTGAGDQFASVFGTPGLGIVKSGGAIAAGTFDAATAAMTASGTAPLAEALQDVSVTLVEPAFRRVGGERRYLAMFTDGLSTAGAGLASIADHSLGATAVFAMGFGIGSGASDTNLAAMAAKGATLNLPQVFHGENAGTIDKFFSSALARAIGFNTIFDPAFELFEGEHVHVGFDVTSAEDVLLVTVQGVDFDDANWTFHLHGPDGAMVHGMDASCMGGGMGGAGMDAHGGCAHACCRRPHVTASRSNGRVSLVLQRDSADDACWVGEWRLMIAYRAQRLDAMVMPNVGELVQPVAAGPIRGPRYARLLREPRERVPVRNVRGEPRHRLDERTSGTNHNDRGACAVTANIQGRTRLRMELVPDCDDPVAGGALAFRVDTDLLQGSVSIDRAFARLLAPTHDLAAAVADAAGSRSDGANGFESGEKAADPARVLARLESGDPTLTAWRDEELEVVTHADGPAHVHVRDTKVPGLYHVGMIVEGHYCPMHGRAMPESGHDHGSPSPGATASHAHGAGDAADDTACGDDCPLERFTRVLSASVALSAPRTA